MRGGRARYRRSLARWSAAKCLWRGPAIGSRSREHREWHLPTRADWSFAGGQFQQVLASAIPETSIRHQSYRLQSEARRADIAGERFRSKASCSPSNLANPMESHATEITHFFFGQPFRMRTAIALEITSHDVKQPISFPRRVFCARVLNLLPRAPQ